MSKTNRRLLPTPHVAAAAVLAVFANAGHAADEEDEPLFPGEYRGQTSNGLMASLTITPDLRFVYQQDRGGVQRLRNLRKSGKLKVVGPESARAGSVALRWKTRNSVVVNSPYGSGLTGTSPISNEQESGAHFTMRRQGVQGKTKVLTTFTLQPTLPAPDCHAELSISYAQMHERIGVDLTVANDDCAASAGDYTLKVRSSNADGEYRTRTFEERWTRHDAEPVELRRYYPMDGDTTLRWVRVNSSRKTNCRCLAEAAAAPEAAPQQAQ